MSDAEQMDPKPVKLLVIGTALPLQSGSPRQRIAEALRRELAHHAEVTHLTLDAWGGEWADRGRMNRGDRLMAAAPDAAGIRPYLQLPALMANKTNAGDGLPRDPTVSQMQQGWLNPRRRQRIAALAGRMEPDLIVLTDPVLAGLARDLHHPERPLVLLDDGLLDWVTGSADLALTRAASDWVQGFATLIGQEMQNWAPFLSRVASGDDLTIPIARDELLFAKTRSLVVPATGFAWCDQIVLNLLSQFLVKRHDRLAEAREAGLPAEGLEEPNLILTGFAETPLAAFMAALPETTPAPEVHRNWDKLHVSVGAARCLFLPWITPGLAGLARGALAVGTPVLTTHHAAAAQGWTRRRGVFADQIGGLPQALEQMLDPDLLDEAGFRAIAAATPVAEGLAARILGPTMAKSHRPTAPARRIPPLAAAPVVLYNPATRMLLVQLALRASAHVDEVRLLDFDGNELNRLAPPVSMPGPVIAMEGGVVIGRDRLSGGVRIALHDDFGEIDTVAVAVEDFAQIEAEVAMAQVENAMLSGAIWALDSAATRRWAVGIGTQRRKLDLHEAVAMPEIGAHAIPFLVPLPAESAATLEATLWCGHAAGQDTRLEPPPQRPLRLSANLLAASASTQPRPQVTALRNQHVRQRAWIIGNGPSVRLEDLAAIPKGDVVFCFNRFHLSYADSPLREDYVVSADTLMIKDFGQDMIDISTGLPLFCMPASRTLHLSGNFVLLPPGDSHLPIFSLTPDKFVTVGGSSVFVALQMAHYMGIRDVVLYGMDYSFTAKLQRDPRFPFPVSFEEGNHFIKSYRGAKPWCPPTWRDISAGFINARVAFELSGGRIVNATRGGQLETFARVDFDTVNRQPVRT